MSHWSPEHGSLDLATLRQLLRSRRHTPQELLAIIYTRIRASTHPNLFITLLDEQIVQTKLAALQQRARDNPLLTFPLFAIPFVVKDNIDVADLHTTAACRDFAYTPKTSAAVVEKLEAAGALLLGKTNLDQFATGLTGTVSSYGPTKNPFNPAFISGGSSSGSAIAVAAGLASFALGTDTAGSGRVPAAFNNLIGLKPTRGLVSNRGVFPACRSLDCVAFFANNVDDAAELLTLTKGFDPADTYSRREAAAVDLSVLEFPVGHFRFGVPRANQLQFHGDADAEALYRRSLDRLESIGGRRVEIDVAPFLDAGKLLYEGPWVAERLAAVAQFHAGHESSFEPVIHQIMARAHNHSSLAVFKSLYRLQELRRQAEAQWALMDLLVLPTAPTILTLNETLADPAAASAKLGLYTNFVNLLDLTAIALPAGFLPPPRDLPFGITLIAPAFHEPNLLAIAQQFATNRYGGLLGSTAHAILLSTSQQNDTAPPAPSPDLHPRTNICVVGAHLAGQPLNYQLTELDGQLVRRCKTAPLYRLYALPNTTPPKPGLAHITPPSTGTAIDVEVWSLPTTTVGTFMARVPAPLCIGTIALDNGESIKGFLCEPHALTHATDISHHGGWLHYLKSLTMPTPA